MHAQGGVMVPSPADGQPPRDPAATGAGAVSADDIVVTTTQAAGSGTTFDPVAEIREWLAESCGEEATDLDVRVVLEGFAESHPDCRAWSASQRRDIGAIVDSTICRLVASGDGAVEYSEEVQAARALLRAHLLLPALALDIAGGDSDNNRFHDGDNDKVAGFIALPPVGVSQPAPEAVLVGVMDAIAMVTATKDERLAQLERRVELVKQDASTISSWGYAGLANIDATWLGWRGYFWLHTAVLLALVGSFIAAFVVPSTVIGDDRVAFAVCELWSVASAVAFLFVVARLMPWLIESVGGGPGVCGFLRLFVGVVCAFNTLWLFIRASVVLSREDFVGLAVGHAENVAALVFLFVAVDVVRPLAMADAMMQHASLFSNMFATPYEDELQGMVEDDAAAAIERLELLAAGRSCSQGYDVVCSAAVPTVPCSGGHNHIPDWTCLPRTTSGVVGWMVAWADRGSLLWMGIKDLAMVIHAKDRLWQAVVRQKNYSNENFHTGDFGTTALERCAVARRWRRQRRWPCVAVVLVAIASGVLDAVSLAPWTSRATAEVYGVVSSSTGLVAAMGVVCLSCLQVAELFASQWVPWNQNGRSCALNVLLRILLVVHFCAFMLLLHGMDAALYRSQVERAHLDQVAAGEEAEVDLDHLSSTVGLVYYAIGVGVSVALAASPAMFKRSARAYSTTMKTVFLQPGENVKHKPQMAIPRPSPLVAWRRLCFSTFADTSGRPRYENFVTLNVALSLFWTVVHAVVGSIAVASWSDSDRTAMSVAAAVGVVELAAGLLAGVYGTACSVQMMLLL